MSRVKRRPFVDPPMSIATQSSAVNLTGTWRYGRPVLLRRVGPCTEACPAGEATDEVMLLAREGRFDEAYRLIREENPLPGVCGRVCLHFCESACLRRSFDEAVSVRGIERALADYAREKGIAPGPAEEATGRSIAVVGSGPAGLSAAYFSAMRGHRVVIFEADAAPGGMLSRAIPEYRLPRSVLEWEIGQILSLGIELHLTTRVGRDVTMDDLGRFDAVLLAPGAALDAPVAGIGPSVKGVYGALEFLRQGGKTGEPQISGRVLIVGGGNTAIDVARVALRRGGEPVILYRRSRDEMPASDEEISQAEREGVVFRYLTGVTAAAMGREGEVKGLSCVRTALGEEDGSGRKSFRAVEGSAFEIEADHVVLAAGQRTDLSFLAPLVKIEDGLIEVARDLRTSLPGVFAAGDAVDQPRTVAHAIASGKRAALSLDHFLKGRPRDEGVRKAEVVPYEELRTDSFSHSRRLAPPVLSARESRSGFAEVEQGFSRRQAISSAKRCFVCGICSFCSRCEEFCPDLSMRLDPPSGQREIDYDHCKGCGICVEECPRGAIGWESEK